MTLIPIIKYKKCAIWTEGDTDAGLNKISFEKGLKATAENGYTLYAETGSIDVNIGDNKADVQLDGDIYSAAQGKIDTHFTTAKSYFTGITDYANGGSIDFTFDNGAV